MIGRSVDMIIYIKKEGIKRRIDEIIHVKGYDKVTQEYQIEHIA